jgi:hypothetical protein
VKQLYILILLAFILAFGFYINITAMYAPKSSSYGHNHEHEVDEVMSKYYTQTDLTWEDLIKDCGAHVMIENSARANEIFNRKYFKKVIEWKGYFINAFVQNINPMDLNPEHLVNINIRMIPSESIKNPDLFLSLDYKKYHKYLNTLQSLRTGDPIKFKASFEAIGNEWRSHHLHLIHLEKTEEFVDSDHKVVLFQGVNFNITGHLKIHKEVQELQLLTDIDGGEKGEDKNEKFEKK